MSTDIQNLKSFDPFAEAEDAGGEIKVGNQQNYIHIRIQRMFNHSPYLIRFVARSSGTRTTIPIYGHCHLTARLTSPRRAQWSQDLDYGPRPPQEVRPEEDPQSDQEAIRLQWHCCRRHRDGRGDPAPGRPAQGCPGFLNQ